MYVSLKREVGRVWGTVGCGGWEGWGWWILRHGAVNEAMDSGSNWVKLRHRGSDTAAVWMASTRLPAYGAGERRRV